jgi:hypothetical protein
VNDGKIIGLNVSTSKFELEINDEYVLRTFHVMVRGIRHIPSADVTLDSMHRSEEKATTDVLSVKLLVLRRLSLFKAHRCSFPAKNCFAKSQLLHALYAVHRVL